jgi:hypothetical protein
MHTRLLGLSLIGRPGVRYFATDRYDQFRTLKIIKAAVDRAGPQMLSDLKEKNWCMVDNFLTGALPNLMRTEAELLYTNGNYNTSKSTTWDYTTSSVKFYDKHNVFSTSLQGKPDYKHAPRLNDYIVGMWDHFVPYLQTNFPEAQLSTSAFMNNKLAVCTGDGSAYDKHIDNTGLDGDLRKATVIYYMNDWREELGGELRIHNAGVVDTKGKPRSEFVQPQKDRLVVFWSDRIVHSVMPSQAFNGAADYRYALTLWLKCTSPSAIGTDEATIKQHFGKYVLR